MHIHPVFHVHLLKPYVDSHMVVPERVVIHSRPAPEIQEEGEEPEWTVESILNQRQRGRQLQYLVKWQGYPIEEATWEPEAHLTNATELIQEFQERVRQ